MYKNFVWFLVLNSVKIGSGLGGCSMMINYQDHFVIMGFTKRSRNKFEFYRDVDVLPLNSIDITWSSVDLRGLWSSVNSPPSATWTWTGWTIWKHTEISVLFVVVQDNWWCRKVTDWVNDEWSPFNCIFRTLKVRMDGWISFTKSPTK